MVQIRLLAVSLFTESFNKAMRDAEKGKIEQSVKNIEKTAMQRVSPNSLSTTLTTSVEGRKGQNSVSSTYQSDYIISTLAGGGARFSRSTRFSFRDKYRFQ